MRLTSKLLPLLHRFFLFCFTTVTTYPPAPNLTFPIILLLFLFYPPHKPHHNLSVHICPGDGMFPGVRLDLDVLEAGDEPLLAGAAEGVGGPFFLPVEG